MPGVCDRRRAELGRLTRLTWREENHRFHLLGPHRRFAMRSVPRSVFAWLYRVRVIGDVAPVERERRVLVVANCPSRLAALLLGLHLPRSPLVVLPPAQSRGFVERILLRLVDHVVSDMSDPLLARHLLQQLRAGRPVVLFPEARVNDGFGVGKVYPAAALVAAQSGAAVVPVGITASLRLVPWAANRHVTTSLTLRVFASTSIDGGDGSARKRRARATRRLTEVMQETVVAAFVRKPVFETFLDAIAVHGRSHTILEDQDRQPRSYGQILKGSLAISRWIRRDTVRGENVGVLLPNVIASVAAVLGLWAAARVPAIFNFTAGAAAVNSAATAAGVRTVITSRKFISQAQLEPVLEVLGACRILYLEDLRSQFGLFDKLWLMAFACRFPRLAIVKSAVSDPAAVLFTSGSEDRPKGVVLSHNAVLSNVAQISAVFDFSPRDRIFNPLPIYHAYSFSAGLVLSLVTGTRMFLYISPLKYGVIPELVYRSECTVLFGTSTFLSYYEQNAVAADFRSLRCVISGGERLSAAVARAWQERFGLRIYEGYGTTEAGPVISLSTHGDFRPGSVGRFMPRLQTAIRPVDGVERGGVLHIKGPNLMLGYYRHQRPGVIEPPRSPVGAGWYDTGDIVDVDDDGMVTIVGRVRRFAKIAGEMVSLDAVEQLARSASGAHQHAAVALLREDGAETTVLFTTDDTLTRSRLLAAARSAGAHELAVARKVVKLAQMPLLSTGKTDYVALGALIRDDTYGRLIAAAAGLSLSAPGATGGKADETNPASSPRTSR